MAQHRAPATPRWRTLLARVTGRARPAPAIDAGTQLLPVYDPPTTPLPVYTQEAPQC